MIKDPFNRVVHKLDDVYNPPKPSDGGGSCAPCNTGNATGNCGLPSGRVPRALKRGTLPAVVALCEGDAIIRAGRQNAINVPAFVVEELFARGITSSPSAPLAQSGTVAGGVLTLTVTATAPTLPSGAGSMILTPGFIVEIATNNNVSPGTTRLQASGLFEDGQTYLQVFEVTQAKQRNSRFLVTFTKEVGGGTYPSLIQVRNGELLTAVAGSIPLTAAAAPNDATAIVPTNGIRGPSTPFQLDVLDGVNGTNVRVELLSPDSQFYDMALRYFYDSL